MDPPDPDIPATSLAMVVEDARCGDQRAWDDLVARFSPLLVKVCLRLRLRAAEVEDVAQVVWLRLVEHIGDLHSPEHLAGWLVTTARREAFRQLAARRRVVPHDPADLTWHRLGDDDAEVDEDLLAAEEHEALLAGFAELSPRQRELLMLLSVDPPLSYREISRRTGIPVGSIGPTRGRALDVLRASAPLRDLRPDPRRGGGPTMRRTPPE